MLSSAGPGCVCQVDVLLEKMEFLLVERTGACLKKQLGVDVHQCMDEGGHSAWAREGHSLEVSL